MDNFLNSILIIIVTYNRRLESCESFQSILKMSITWNNIDVFVYDNSKEPQSINDYKNISIKYVNDPSNPGISKAYNLGVDYAHSNKKKWVLFLDQDTILPSDILESYKQAARQNPNIKLFVPKLFLGNGVLLSPCKYLFKRGFHIKKIGYGLHSLNKISPVNSGMFIEINAFLKVGGYNERVRLDFSDFQFIERFRKVYKEFYVIDIICTQDFSNDDVSISSQIGRFKYYCEGAKNVDKEGIWDYLQYAAVVLVRTLKLTGRHKKSIFLQTYFNTFLN